MAIKRDDFPLPDVTDPITAPFFAGAARGELLITRCTTCRSASSVYGMGKRSWVYVPETPVQQR